MKYDVAVELQVTVYMEVEADNEDQAIEDARATYNLSDAQHPHIMDVTVTEAEDEE